MKPGDLIIIEDKYSAYILSVISKHSNILKTQIIFSHQAINSALRGHKKFLLRNKEWTNWTHSNQLTGLINKKHDKLKIRGIRELYAITPLTEKEQAIITMEMI